MINKKDAPKAGDGNYDCPNDALQYLLIKKMPLKQGTETASAAAASLFLSIIKKMPLKQGTETGYNLF